jgi:hypothetical protein
VVAISFIPSLQIQMAASSLSGQGTQWTCQEMLKNFQRPVICAVSVFSVVATKAAENTIFYRIITVATK